jgi:hypothetical protein
LDRSSVITVSAWLRIGPTLARPASSLLTLRNCEMRPVGGVLAPLVAVDRLVDLAGEQDVADARRDRGREVDDTEAVERLAGATEAVVHREVLQQRGLRVDRQRVEVAAVVRPLDDPALLVGQRRHVEQLRDALPPLDLAEEHGLAPRRQRQGERRRDRGLAGAALAGHDMQADVAPALVGGGGAHESEGNRIDVPTNRC